MFTAQLLLMLLTFCSVRSAVPIRRDKFTASGSMSGSTAREDFVRFLEFGFECIVFNPTIELDEVKKNNLVNVLLAILDWASPWADTDTMNNEDPELNYRPQRSMYNPPMAREKSMCKNFFWKTFSAC